jgi:hypothetical protein
MALTMKSLDTMKISRDSGSITNAQKIEHINAIVQLIPDITHIAIGCYGNNFGYQSVAYIKEWFDAIHNAGKKVLFRPALAGSFATPADLTTQKVQEVTDFAACWASTGDIWDVIPETNPLSALYTNVAGWNTFVRNTITALDTAFASLGKTVDHTYWSQTDQTFLFNSRVEASTLTAMGNNLCLDFYPMDYIGSPGKGSTVAKVNNCIAELGTAHANYPTANIYITEIGYNNTTAVTDEDQREVLRVFFNAVKDLSYIKGINYWVGYGDSQYDKTYTFQSTSRTLPRPAIQVISDFYTNGICSKRMNVI